MFNLTILDVFGRIFEFFQLFLLSFLMLSLAVNISSKVIIIRLTVLVLPSRWFLVIRNSRIYLGLFCRISFTFNSTSCDTTGCVLILIVVNRVLFI